MADKVKDFHTGEMVTRIQYRVPSKRCSGCGTLTTTYDAKWGWHICSDCDSEDVAADIADHVMNPNRGYTKSLY
jgi:hypothetical protein